MKIVVVFFTFIISISNIVFASSPYSAKRLPNESYLDKVKGLNKRPHLWSRPPSDDDTAYEAATKFDKLDEAKVKPWTGSVDFQTFFRNVRDERFLKKNPAFPRRLTWLYPDDGCYARAEIASQKARTYDFSGGSKIFVFGDLTVKTNNSPNGSVSWWYHVATAYRFNDVTYIIDPAIDPDQPQRLESWLATMGDIHKFEISICNATAYDPGSTCSPMKSTPTEYAFEDIEEFLKLEWSRLEDLGRTPDKELGDEPPWKKNL